MMEMVEKEVVILIKGKHVKGITSIVSSAEYLWEFKSDDPYFLEVYPAGRFYSFGYIDDGYTPSKSYHDALETKVREVLRAVTGC